jgi:hypothetical protein
LASEPAGGLTGAILLEMADVAHHEQHDQERDDLDRGGGGEDSETVLHRTGRLSLTDGGPREVTEVRVMQTDDEHRGARLH